MKYDTLQWLFQYVLNMLQQNEMMVKASNTFTKSNLFMLLIKALHKV